MKFLVVLSGFFLLTACTSNPQDQAAVSSALQLLADSFEQAADQRQEVSDKWEQSARTLAIEPAPLYRQQLSPEEMCVASGYCQ